VIDVIDMNFFQSVSEACLPGLNLSLL